MRKLTFAPEADWCPTGSGQDAPALNTVLVALLWGEGQRGKHVGQVVSAGGACELCTDLQTGRQLFNIATQT